MEIVIIGAGLGGLTAAFCFARQGYHVTILEKRKTLLPQGGGISVRACASRMLHAWGLEADLAAIGDITPTALLRNLDTGEVTQRSILLDVSESPEWGTSRQLLIQLFYHKALQAGSKIRFGCDVVDVHESDDHASVVLGDGNTLNADLVLAADGIRSRIRSRILSDVQTPIEPIVSDTTLHTIQLTGDELLSLPDSKSLMDEASHNINVWMGYEVFAVSRFSEKRSSWGGIYGIKSDLNSQKGLWDEHGDIDYVRSHFVRSCPALFMPLTIAKSCDRWKLAEMPDLPRWTSLKGRILLLGDSAHGMHPNAAQGYSQIIEDIGVLDYLLRTSLKEHKSMSTLTYDWQQLRKPRVERIKAYARWNTDLFQGEPLAPMESGAKSQIKSLKNTVPDRNASFHSAAFMKWCLDHDAIAEAKTYLESTRARL